MTDATLYTVKLFGLVPETGDYAREHIRGLARALSVAASVMTCYADALEEGARLSIEDESNRGEVASWVWQTTHPPACWLVETWERA